MSMKTISPRSSTEAGSNWGDESAMDEVLLEKSSSSRRQRVPPQWVSKVFNPTVGHGLLIFLYTSIFLLALRSLPSREGLLSTTYSAEREHIPLETQAFDVPRIPKNPYSGEPRQELDKAWHELLEYTTIKVPVETVERLGRTDQGILLPDGSAYLGSLSVYHQLHCIKRLHQFMYTETYFPNMTAEEAGLNKLHNEHCLDFLRQSLMCNGDMTLLTLRWAPHSVTPLTNVSAVHECRNWDAIENWAKERTIDPFEPGLLVHPTLGEAFPKGYNEKGAIGTTTPYEASHD